MNLILFTASLITLGLDDPYDYIDYDELPDEQKKIVDSLNLQDMLNKQIQSKDEIDAPLVRFCLRRLSQLRDS